MFCELKAIINQQVDHNGHSYYVDTPYRFTKFHTNSRGSKSDIKLPVHFSVNGLCNPMDLDELYPKIKNWLFNDQILIVRGDLKEKEKSKFTSTSNSIFTRSQEHFNWDIKSKIIVFDIDELNLPRNLKSTDILKQGKHVVQLLHKLDPESFPNRNLPFIAKASSSSGLVGQNKIKLHLFMQNDKEISRGQLKTFVSILNEKYKESTGDTANLLDPALYSRSQPIFIAKPVFANPADDPYRKDELARIAHNAPKNKTTTTLPDNLEEDKALAKVTSHEVNSLLDMYKGRPDKLAVLNRRIETLKDAQDKDNYQVRTAVQAIYHAAIQQTYDLDLLEQEIIPYIQRARPHFSMGTRGSDKDGTIMGYITQGRNVAAAKLISINNRIIPEMHGKYQKIEKIECKSQRFLEPEFIPEANSITFMKASLGTGKTTLISNWKRNGKLPGTFLTLTDTISLVKGNCTTFDAYAFNSEEPKSLEHLESFEFGKPLESGDVVTSLSGTIQSIHKLEGLRFNTIFIDEADSVFQTMLLSSTMGNKKGKDKNKKSLPGLDDEGREKAFNTLKELFLGADRIFLADGDLSEESVSGWLDMVALKPKVYSMNHPYKRLKDLGAKTYFHKSKDSVIAQALNDAQEGSKCLLVTDLGPSKIEELRYKFEALDISVECIHGDTYKQNKKINSIISTKSSGLENYKVQVLITSPSITSGVDFEYFDATYVVSSSLMHTPRKRFQASQRCRKSAEFHIYNTHKSTPYFTVFNTPDLLDNKIGHYTAKIGSRDYAEMKTFASSLNYLFVEAGSTVQYSPTVKVNSDLDIKCRSEYLRRTTDTIMSCKSLEDKPKNYKDAWKVKSTVIPALYGEEACDDLVMHYLEDRPDKKAAFLSTYIGPFEDCIVESIEKSSIVPMYKEMKSRGAELYSLTGTPEFKNEKELSEMLKLSGLDVELSLEENMKMYRIYVEELSEGLKMPEVIEEKLNGLTETIGDM